jgi:GR25 family glycosyltransferase involved in LPS biosynthesis
VEWGSKRWDFVAMEIPVFSPDNIPIYCINLKRRPDRREKIKTMLNNVPFEFVYGVDGKSITPSRDCFHFYVGNIVGHKPGLVGCALSHVHLWEALVRDPHHEYYIILEDDIECTTKTPFCANDVFSTFYSITRQLDSLVSWDVVFLGYTREHAAPSCPDPSLRIQPLSPDYLGGTFGYILHKKCAQFLTTVISHFGMFVAIDNLWHYYSVHSPFLRLFQLNHDYVSSTWIRPQNMGACEGDSDIQTDARQIRYCVASDFVVMKDSVPDPDHSRIMKKEWFIQLDFASYAMYSKIYVGFTSHGVLFGPTESSIPMRFQKKNGVHSYLYRPKMMTSL